MFTNPNPLYVVDGHEFDDEDSALLGDGQFAPFRVFDTVAQQHLALKFGTREDAEAFVEAVTSGTDNDDRAGWARVALEAFITACPTDREDAIGDLITDLLHLAMREYSIKLPEAKELGAKAVRMFADEVETPL